MRRASRRSKSPCSSGVNTRSSRAITLERDTSSTCASSSSASRRVPRNAAALASAAPEVTAADSAVRFANRPAPDLAAAVLEAAAEAGLAVHVVRADRAGLAVARALLRSRRGSSDAELVLVDGLLLARLALVRATLRAFGLADQLDLLAAGNAAFAFIRRGRREQVLDL